MKSTAILQSNVLDIIFENRNKDYGAYLLRKNYNKRLGSAVFIMIGLVIILSIFFIYSNAEMFSIEKKIMKVAVPLQLSTYRNVLKNLKVKIAHPVNKVKPSFIENTTPVILADKNINKITAAGKIELPSQITSKLTAISFLSAEGETGKESIEGINKTIVPGKINKDELPPADVAEIMPQYPGGIKALLTFLKNNIHAPAELNEGEEVTVRIKFVINYSGKIESWQILQSGGAVFDNEVLRVLMKMPLWIPGKSKGENISVYYYIPVKFTSDL